MKKIETLDAYKEQYARSIEHPELFWEEQAEHFIWQRKWDRVLEWNFTDPEIKWFQGASGNITENAIDRYVQQQPDAIAIIWEPNEPGDAHRIITYRELSHEVNKLANALKELGIKKGDRVCIYMPMIPEGAYAMLACARIGAIHSVVFAGFSATSLIDRINDCECKLVITADASYRGTKCIELKKIVDEAIAQTPSVKHTLVYNHCDVDIKMKYGRDIWWHDCVPKQDPYCKAEAMKAEDPLFILYTSGSTGKPKGVLHTSAGYMVYTAYTFLNVFNYKKDDIFWCTADIGWITGHSYLVYGALLNGACTLFYEGIPTYPDHGRFWDIVDKHCVNILYTAPTAIRALEIFGNTIFESKKLDSLRVLGTVGEPINEEAWHWYHTNVGKEKCPIVDTWWQTETGGVLLSPIAYVTPLKPCFATLPLPGVQPVLVDDKGNIIEGNGVEGNLCMRFPWPGMARTVYKNHQRFKETYFSTYVGLYFTGDGCKRDEQGYYRITGRVDDVINVSGHRIGTGEVEDAIDMHVDVVETAVVGYHHDIKGQGIYAYIVCYHEITDKQKLISEINALVTQHIGALAKPEKIQIVDGLPKTRSGKIMRRILRKIAENDFASLGDTSTLLDPSVVDRIIDGKNQ